MLPACPGSWASCGIPGSPELHVLAWLLVAPLALWASGSVVLSGGYPGDPSLPRWLLLVGLWGLVAWDRRAVALLVAMGTALFMMQRPQQVRDWSEDQSRVPSITWHDATRFTVSVLREDQVEVARLFGLNSGREIDKWARVEHDLLGEGIPAVAGCAARYLCTIENRFTTGDHDCLVGRIDVAEEVAGGPALPMRGRDYAPRPDED